MAGWLPLSKISGTVMPRNSRGLVYCGYSIRPVWLWVSSTALWSSPNTPGTRRITVSIKTIAGTSPPLHTKSPIDISRGFQTIANALVESFIAAAQQQQPFVRCQLRQPDRLRQPFAGRREHDQQAGISACACTASTAANTGSHISTMPGPPPKGRSSTLLCLPVDQSRIFHKWIDTSRRRSPTSRCFASDNPKTSRGTTSARRNARHPPSFHPARKRLAASLGRPPLRNSARPRLAAQRIIRNRAVGAGTAQVPRPARLRA